MDDSLATTYVNQVSKHVPSRLEPDPSGGLRTTELMFYDARHPGMDSPSYPAPSVYLDYGTSYSILGGYGPFSYEYNLLDFGTSGHPDSTMPYNAVVSDPLP